MEALSSLSYMAGRLGAGVVTGAKIYKNTIDTAYYVGWGTLECSYSAASVVGSAWNKGLKGTIGEIAKTCIGINDLVKAKQEISNPYVTFFNGRTERLCQVRRTVPERMGAAMGHVTNAATKAVTSGAILAGAMTYGIGAARNALGMSYSNDTYFAGAQMAASGINMAVKAIANPILTYSGPAISLVGNGVSYVIANSSAIATVGVPVAGAGALLYLAACEVENAAASTRKIGKVFHGAVALAATASACSVPGLASAVGLS